MIIGGVGEGIWKSYYLYYRRDLPVDSSDNVGVNETKKQKMFTPICRRFDAQSP